MNGGIKQKIFDQILEMQAVEIEQCLTPPFKEKALCKAMFGYINSKAELIDGNFDDKEKELQILLGSYRVLYKWDESMLRYLLLTLY